MLAMGQGIRVVIADAYECVRASVAGYVNGQGDLELVDAVPTLADAFDRLRQGQVDCLIAGAEGMEHPPLVLLDLIEQQAPETRVIFHTSTTTRAGELLRGGARGYLHWRDPLAFVGTAIRTVQAGRMYVSPHAQAALTPSEWLTYEWQLTRQEHGVLTLLAQGYTRRAIAHQLEASEQDISTILDHLLRRTGMETLDRLASAYRNHVHGTHADTRHAGAMTNDLPDPLSRREYAVLQLLRLEYTNQHIADELVLSMGTVKYHLQHLFDKLGVRTRRRAVQVALQRGIL